MNEELIGGYVNRDNFRNDTKFMKDELESVVALFTELSNIKISIGKSNDIKSVAEGITNAGKVIGELNANITILTGKFGALNNVQGIAAKGLKENTKTVLDFNEALKAGNLDGTALTTEDYTKILETAAAALEGLNEEERKNIQILIEKNKALQNLKQAEIPFPTEKIHAGLGVNFNPATDVDVTPAATTQPTTQPAPAVTPALPKPPIAEMEQYAKVLQGIYNNLDKVKITTSEYRLILEAIIPDVDKFTDEQKAQFAAITENYKANELIRQEAKNTVALLQKETNANENLDAARSESAKRVAESNVELKRAADLRKAEAQIAVTEEGSIKRAEAVRARLLLIQKNINVTTEEGAQKSTNYKNKIEQLNEFIRINSDKLTQQKINIGNYNTAAQIVVTGLETERKELEKLIATREKAIKVQQVTGFARGNNPAPGTGGQTATANPDAKAFEALGDDAKYATINVEDLDKKIASATVRVEGFRRASEDIPLGKESAKAETQVDNLTASLNALEKNGLGTSEAADLLRTKIDALTTSMYKAVTASEALSFVDNEIAALSKDIAGLDKNSKGFSDLSTKISTLKNVSANLNRNFSSPKQEIRALDIAAQNLGRTFGVDSEQFTKFANILGARKNEIKDAQAAVNFKSSDTQGLDAALQGVQALTSGYGAYVAVSTLAGASTEATQESMQKLQAVTALVASVQGIVNALQSESALIQGSLAAKTALLATVNRVSLALSGRKVEAYTAEALATQASIGATVEKTVVENSALAATRATALANTQSAIAMKAGAVSSLTLSTGLKGVAAAEGAVAVGATTAAKAIAATGIGLLIVGIAYGIYKLVSALKEWSDTNASVVKANDELAESITNLITTTKQYEDLLANFTDINLKRLQDENEFRKALGVTQGEALAMDLAEIKVRKELAEKEVKQNNITAASYRAKQTAAIISAKKLQDIDEARAAYLERVRAQGDPDFEEETKNFEKLRKIAADEVAITSGLYQQEATKFEGLQKIKQEEITKVGAISKLSSDELRKFTLESAKIEISTTVAKNESILSNERSSLTQQLDAISSNLKQKKRLLAAENAATQSDPTVSNTDKALATKKLKADIAQAEADTDEKLFAKKEAFRIRDLNASTEIEKKIYDTVAKYNEQILSSEGISEDQRLNALVKFTNAKKAILDAELNKNLSTAGFSDTEIQRIKETGEFEISNKKITVEELEKLTSDYESDVINLAVETNTKRIAISKDYYEKEEETRTKGERSLEEAYNKSVEDRQDTFNNQLIELNQQYSKNLISAKEYGKQRKKLEQGLGKDLLEIQAKNLQAQLDNLKVAKEVETSLKAEIVEATTAFENAKTDKEKAAAATRLGIIKKELEAIQLVIGKETELYKQLSEAIKQISENVKGLTDTMKDEFQTVFEGLTDTAKSLATSFGDIFSGINDRRIQELEKQGEAIDINKQKAIDAVNAQVLGEEDKAQKLKAIEIKAQQDKDLVASKEKQLQQQAARVQKALAIFNIGLSTAQAIAKAYAQLGPLGGTAGAVLAAAVGAAQLAAAIAAPIPKFKHGKDANNTYEGPAIVDDGGVREPILRAATGKVEIAGGPAKDRLTYLGKKDIVFPSVTAMLKNFSTPVMNNTVIVETDNGMSEVGRELRKQNALLQAIADKPSLTLQNSEQGMLALFKFGNNQLSYINDQTNWNS